MIWYEILAKPEDCVCIWWFVWVPFPSSCVWAAHPLLLAPSTTLRMADLLDFGVSVASKSLATDRFSVDLLSAASRSKTQRASAERPQNTNDGGFWDREPHSQHGMLMMVCLMASLLGTPCSKRLDRSSRNHSPVATFSSLQTQSPLSGSLWPPVCV